MDGCSKQTIELRLALDMWTPVRGSVFCVTERWIETADYIWRRSALCARNSIFQMICLALKFPLLHFGDYIKCLCCKASGSVTAWLNSLPPYLSFSLLLCIFFSVQWSQREPDTGDSKESFQRSCGDQEPVSGTLAVLSVHVYGVRTQESVCVCTSFTCISPCLQICTTPMCLCINISLC